MRIGDAALLAVFLCLPAQAMDTDGLSRKLTPSQREWVRGLKNKIGMPCCDTADGADVPWEGTADGHYRVLIHGEWVDVTEAATLDDRPNVIGIARVWFYVDGAGKTRVRCFLPGGGT